MVVTFAAIVYLFLIHEKLIQDSYFLDGFNRRLYWYSIPGYGAAIICFAAYLFLANKLQTLNTDTAKTPEGLAAAQDNYQKLKSTFSFVFNSSAIILSVFVVWLGSLFSAVNNLEAPQYYTLLSGRQLLNYDFVYLMGITHSILLAIFYFPVRIQFNSLELTKDQKASDSSTPTSVKLFKTFGDIIGGILAIYYYRRSKSPAQLVRRLSLIRRTSAA